MIERLRDWPLLLAVWLAPYPAFAQKGGDKWVDPITDWMDDTLLGGLEKMGLPLVVIGITILACFAAITGHIAVQRAIQIILAGIILAFGSQIVMAMLT